MFSKFKWKALLLVMVSTLFLTSCSNQNYNSRIVHEFDDGSRILEQGGPTYYHRLFDGYVIYCGDSYFQDRLEWISENYSSANKELSTKQGYYIRYCFDPDGYIAYYRLIKTEDSSLALYQKQYGEAQVSISEETVVLYVCSEDTELNFNTTSELFDYCQANDINLGRWYYGNCIDNPTETIICENGEWQILERPWDGYIVRQNNTDMFTGDIDKYCMYNQYLIFHLQITETSYYRGDENPVLTDLTDAVVGQKFEGLLKGFCDIYFDRYIVVDTIDGSYEMFEAKKDAENCLNENNVDVQWKSLR